MLNYRNFFWQIYMAWFVFLLAIHVLIGLFYPESFENQNYVIVEKKENLINYHLHNGTVTFLTVQTYFSPGWCRMQASALLSGISVVSLGIGRNYSHTIRPRWILKYIKKKKLSANHVLVFMDGGDTFFTSGLTMQKAIINFIKHTAATANEFDAKAVMEGKATAPLLFGAEEECWGADWWDVGYRNQSYCSEQYTNACVNGGYTFIPECRNAADKSLFKNFYLNAGTFISRVWAFKKAAVAFYAKLDMRKDIWCDQTVWASVFLDCVLGKVCNSGEKCAPQGLISIDYQNNLSLHPYNENFITNYYRPWSLNTIENYVTKRSPPFPHFFDLADNPNATPAIAHFPWWRLSYLSDIPNMIETSAWVHESHRNSDSILQSMQFLNETATVKFYRANGKEKVIKYRYVCSARRAMNVTWLGMELIK